MTDHAPGSVFALAFAILGLALSPLPPVGLPLAAIALALAWRARRLLRAAPGRWRDSQLPVAAAVIALVAIGLGLVVGFAWAVLVAKAASGAGAEPPLTF